MDKIRVPARKLQHTEISLNRINFKGLEVGSVLSFYFDCLYKGNFDNRIVKNILIFCHIFIRSLFSKCKIRNFGKEIIYFKTGKHSHNEYMMQAVISNDNSNNTLVVGPEGTSDFNMRKVFYLSSLTDTFKILSFFYSHVKAVSALLEPLQLTFRFRLILYLNLLTQLFKANSIYKFIGLQKSIKLVGGDYDRGAESSLFFVVAKALKIGSFTLQHGVINPPVGYSPVIADEIWVWGKMAALQLLELGVTEEKIRITGTPILKQLEISKELKQSAQIKYNLKTGRTIVLALSFPDKDNDLKMVKFLSTLKNQFGSSADNFLVKVHPARHFYQYSWIKEDHDIQLLPQNIPYEDFLNLLDVLLAHTSGIATEALYYRKKVGILDILDESPGNGLELNKYFNVPLIKTSNDFFCLLNNDLQINSGTAFFKIGENAKKEISKLIHEKLNDSNNDD